MKKLLILIHRYVGIAISLLMVAWCVSGFVMMYVGYPQLDEQERIAGLAALDLEGCCATDRILESLGDMRIGGFAVEMQAGLPILKVRGERGSIRVALRIGEPLDAVTKADALDAARDFMRARSLEGTPVLLASVDTDQWTVSGEYNADRPLYRIAAGDSADTQLYVSSSSGEVVLDTTARERTWNWLGAVTHWFYPVVLRQHGAVWSQVVIWTSLIGTFLTLTGVWLGVMQIRAGRTRGFSPYKGWNLWHHLSGLVFGILLLTWVGSGLLSMNPWGLLEGAGGREESERLRGIDFTSREAVAVIQQFAAGAARDQGAVRIASAPFAGRLYVTVRSQSGLTRLDASTLEPVALAETELQQSAAFLQPGVAIAGSEMLTAGDAYYYDDHDGPRPYPVYRVILGDEERTRYYIDPVDGRLLQKTDREGRWYRWLFQALHRWDFAPMLQQRPVWDLVVLTLLFGVTAVSATGLYLGYRRIRPRRHAEVPDGQAGPD